MDREGKWNIRRSRDRMEHGRRRQKRRGKKEREMLKSNGQGREVEYKKRQG